MAVRVTSDHGLVWNATIDDTELNRIAQQIERRILGMSNNVVREGDRMDKMFKNLTASAAAFFSLQQGSQLVDAIIKVRAEFQKYEAVLTNTLGSQKDAADAMALIKDIAASTPFGVGELTASYIKLVNQGFKPTRDMIISLGDLAASQGKSFDQLTEAIIDAQTGEFERLKEFGIRASKEGSKVTFTFKEQAKTVDFAAGSIRDYILSLGKMEGVAGGMEAISKTIGGQISNLEDSIESMFNEIGEASEGFIADSISGIAYLVENYKEIGKILDILITTYGAYRAALILTAAIEKARYLTTLQLGAAEGTVTVAKALHTQATNILAAAQARLNAIMATNPYIAIATAVAALASAYYFLGDRTSVAERAQKAYNEALNEVKSGTQDLAGKSRELLGILNDDTQTRASQIIAFQDLNNLYKGRLTNLDLESFKLQTVEERQRAVNVALADYTIEALRAQKAQAQDVIAKNGFEQQVWYKEIGELLSDIVTLEDSQAKRLDDAIELEKLLTQEIDRQEEARKLAAMTDAERLEYAKKQLTPLEMQLKSWEATNGELRRNKDGLIETDNILAKLTIQPVLNQYNQWLGLINSVNSALNGLPKIRTINDIDEDIKKTKDAQKGTSSNKSDYDFITGTYTKGYAEYDRELEKLEAEKRAITGELSEEQKKAQKEQEAAAKKAATAAKQIADEQKRLIESITEAEKQATISRMIEGEKQVAENKLKFDKIRKSLKEAGIKEGTVAFTRIDVLEKQVSNDLQYAKDTDDVKKYLEKQKELYQQYNDFKEKAGLEAANKEFERKIQLDRSFNEIVSQSLENHLASQIGKQPDFFSQARELMLREFQDAGIKEDSGKKLQALVDLASYNQKREIIIAAYNEKVKLLGEKATEEQKAESERQKKIALGQLADEYADRLIQSKSFFTGLVLVSRQAVQAQIKNIQRLLQLSNLDPETKKKLQNDLEETKKLLKVNPEELELAQLKKQLKEVDEELQKINDHTPESIQRKSDLMVQRTNLNLAITGKNLTAIDKALNKISKAAPAIAALGEAISSIGGEGSGLSELGAGLSAFAGGLQGLITQVKDLNSGKTTATSTDAYVAAAQFAFQIITAITDAKKKRKQAEEDFYISVLGLQNDYNLALIEQKRLQAELNENVFVKDYFGRAKSGMEAAIAAAEKYQKALDELSKGRAKERQKNVVDGKTVGQLALSGAAAGAVIGAVAGVGVFSAVGAAVGAVIGGIVGAIGGLFAKKKKDVYGGLLEQYPELLKKGANGQREINRELAEALIKNNQLDAKTKQLVQNALDQEKAYKAAYDQVRQVVSDLAGSLGDDLRNALVSAWKAGEDGAKAFGNAVDKVLENILSNLIFHAAFDDLFDKLQSSLSDDFVYGGVEDITESLGNFFEEGKKRIPNFNAALDAADELGKKFGLDLKGKTKAGSTNSTSGAIQQITQQQADVLTGQFYAQTTVLNDINAKIPKNYFVDSISMMNRQFDVLNKIEGNTKDTVARLDKAVVSLDSIDKKMNNTANQAAAAGYKI